MGYKDSTAVTFNLWSFGPDEDTKMEAAVDELLTKGMNPWWKFR